MNNKVKGAVFDGTDVNLTDVCVESECSARDALVEVTLCAVCTSDLHIRRGAVPRARPGTILGHEFVGVVRAIGAEAATRKPTLAIGTHVAVNCITFCGDCYYCRHGFINNCEKGGWELGCRIHGAQQSGLVRIPFADTCLAVIPPKVTDEQALFVGDILASGYFSVAELGGVKDGDCVAVIGCGPVGLCAMQCARIRGAKTVVAIDVDQYRLDVAKAHNLADLYINSSGENVDDKVAEQIASINDGRGADCVVEAAGADSSFQLAWKIARPNGTVALIAMYEKPPVFPLPLMYGKNLCWRTGGVDAIHSDYLLQMIAEGRIDTSFLITHRSTLDHIMDLYETLEHAHETNCLKCVVEFGQNQPQQPKALERLQQMEDERIAAASANKQVSAQTVFDVEFNKLVNEARAGASDDVIARMKTLLATNRLAISPYSAGKAQKTIDSLIEERKRSSGSTPDSGKGGVPSFSFSSKLTMTATFQPAAKKAAPDEQVAVQAIGPMKGSPVVVEGCKNLSCRSITLDRLVDCKVQSKWTKDDCPMTLRVLSCSNTVISLHPVCGSIYLEGCNNCTVSVAAHQIRLKNCHNCRIQFVCLSVPVIEESTGIIIAPFLLTSEQKTEQLLSSYGFIRDGTSLNKGTHVQDFQWLSPTEHSPNWTTDKPQPVELQH